MVPQYAHPVEPAAPLFLLFIVLWWFIRHQPEDAAPGEDEGTRTPPPHPHRPGDRGPRHPTRPRRGPHRDPAPPAPKRIRIAARPARVPRRHI